MKWLKQSGYAVALAIIGFTLGRCGIKPPEAPPPEPAAAAAPAGIDESVLRHATEDLQTALRARDDYKAKLESICSAHANVARWKDECAAPQ